MTFYQYLQGFEGRLVALTVAGHSQEHGTSIYLGRLHVEQDFIVLFSTDEDPVPLAIRLEDVRRCAPPESYDFHESDLRDDVDFLLDDLYED